MTGALQEQRFAGAPNRGQAVAVVTGASRGIGRETALALTRRGLSVALVARDVNALAGVRREIEAVGGTCELIGCDVSREEDVANMAQVVLRELGVPELVVNNAGIVERGARVEDASAESWDRVIAVNLRGPFLVARAFVPAMRAAKRGRVVFVASISSTIGCPFAASYAASKWGLVGLAKSLAEELRGSGCEALSILPGSVDTDMLVGSGFSPQMSAEEVARAIVYLGLDAPAAMNGAAVEMFG